MIRDDLLRIEGNLHVTSMQGIESVNKQNNSVNKFHWTLNGYDDKSSLYKRKLSPRDQNLTKRAEETSFKRAERKHGKYAVRVSSHWSYFCVFLVSTRSTSWNSFPIDQQRTTIR